MERSAKRTIFETDCTGSLAIVIGGEQKGIRPLVKKHCDYLAAIPQAGRIDSLNASVAGAVVMYEVYRQRKFSTLKG
jgi:23S rRNA (guanosine2251-2'-O)-methyltransferase